MGGYLSNFIKCFVHLQSIQYFANKHLRAPYIYLQIKTSCTCKVFNTLYLNTCGSIYPTSKKYFLHVQGFQYFAPKYLGSTYPTSKNTSCTCKVFNTLHLYTCWSFYQTLKKYYLHVPSIHYFSSRYLNTWRLQQYSFK